MKKFSIHYAILLTMLFIGFTTMAQQGSGNSQTSNQSQMKTFLIERDIPNNFTDFLQSITRDGTKYSMGRKLCN